MKLSRVVVVASLSAFIAGTLAAWAVQTNYLGTVFIADATTPANQLAINADGSVNVANVSPAASIPVALTVQNLAYSIGNSLGGLQTVAVARVAGGGGMIVGVDYRSKGGSTNQIYVYAWTKSPAATCTDKVAFAENAADIANRIPGFPLSLTPASPGSWDTVTRATSSNMSSSFTNADTTPSTNIYLCVVTAAIVTPATTSDLTMSLAVVKN